MTVNTIRKISVLILLSMLLSCLMAFGASAGRDPSSVDSGGVEEYVQWTMSEDGSVIYGDGVEYTYYETPITSYLITKDVYYYKYSPYDGINMVSYKPGGDIVWDLIGNHGITNMYVTEKGRDMLDRFFSGEGQHFHLCSARLEYSEISGKLIDELRAVKTEENKRSINVTTLIKYDVFTLGACDADELIRYDTGAILRLNDALYYVDYDDLDNSYFDSSGNLSYRKGTLTVYEIGGDTYNKVNSAIDLITYHRRYTAYEYEIWSDDEFDMGLVWTGFICPAGGLAAGIILPHSKRLGKPRRWYILAGLSGAALLLSTILAILYA